MSLRLDEERNVWMQEWEVEENYSISTTVLMLRSTSPAVRRLMEKGYLVGPASTPDHPVDHDALVEYVAVLNYNQMRSDLRSEAVALLGELFPGEDITV